MVIVLYCNHRGGLFSKVCGLCSHVRFAHLFSPSSKWRWAQTFPPRNTIRLGIQLCIPFECVCVCACVPLRLCHHSHTCMYTLVAKQTQVCGVLLRSQALYSHQFYSDCTGVTDHSTHEERQQSNKSCSVSSRLGKHPHDIWVLQSFCAST